MINLSKSLLSLQQLLRESKLYLIIIIVYKEQISILEVLNNLKKQTMYTVRNN